MDDTLKMIDESFQWRKEYAVHGKISLYWFEKCFDMHLIKIYKKELKVIVVRGNCILN